MSVDAGPRAQPEAPGRPPPTARRPARWLRRLAGDRAEERVFRALAFGFLPAGVLFGLLGAPAALRQGAHFPLWWDCLAFVLGVVPPVLLGVGAFLLPIAVLRRIAFGAVAASIAVQASVPLVVQTWAEANGQVWFLQISGLGMIAAALAMRPVRAVLTLVLGAAVTAVTRGATDHTDAGVQGLQDGLYLLLFTVTFVALGIGALQAGRLADEEEARAVAEAGAAAASAARERERLRINALVHDRVLATLLAAARPVPGSSTLERADAQRALDGLLAMLREDDAPDAVSGQAFVWQVQAVTTELAPECGFGYDLEGELVVPPDVAEALLQAVEEALRNSLRHAGDANRTVHVRVAQTGLCVDVLDDGFGFDRAAVPPTRLGIAESIEGRVRTLGGGAADVITRPEVGTRVLLRWGPP